MRSRSRLLDCLDHLLGHFHKFRRLGGRDPGKMKPSRFNPYMFNEVLKQDELSSGIVITFQVMAVSGVSPGDPDAVRPMPQSGQYEFGAYAAGAWNPYNPDVGRILKAVDSCQVGGAIAAPVAQESRNFWLPVSHFFSSFLASLYVTIQVVRFTVQPFGPELTAEGRFTVVQIFRSSLADNLSESIHAPVAKPRYPQNAQSSLRSIRIKITVSPQTSEP